MEYDPSNVGGSTPTVEDLTGKRIAAAVIDLALLTLLGVVMSAIFGDSSSSDDSRIQVSLNLSGVPFIIFVLLCFAYSIVLEAASGQTLGKRVMGLCVAAADGGALTPGKAVVRNLLRFVDGFPYVVPYLVSLLCVLISKRHQRIGDMAAGTVVVRA